MYSFFVSCLNWLSGPVLLYDLIRTARRGRYILLRFLYAGFLLAMLLWIYYLQTFRYGSMHIPAREMAGFAASFFYPFLGVQYFVIVLLTPAYTAGAIAEEKERRTLEFLLATDLSNREIVISKLASRLFNLTLLVLTGLPVLSLLQFLGGVDPNLVLAGFAATGFTMASLAALGILNSVLLKKARDAVVVTYLEALAYVLLSALSLLLISPSLRIADLDLSFGKDMVTVQDVVERFNSGNPLGIYILEEMRTSGSATVEEAIGPVLVGYAIFHGLVALGCSTWAVWRLRTLALSQTFDKPEKISLATRILGRPKIGDRPMIWKEVFSEPGLRFNWLGRIAIALLIVGSFIPALWMIGDFAYEWISQNHPYPSRWEILGYEMNAWVRFIGTAIACLMLLAVGVRAAGSIGGERDRQTLDSLLTSPLDSDAILYGKWLGSMLSVRWAWGWLGLVAFLGLITGGLHILAVPCLLVAWWVLAGFMAVLGLWFSAVSRTTVRANLYTVIGSMGIAFGHWTIWMCCLPLFLWSGQPGSSGIPIEMIFLFQAFGLTPPATLGGLAFHGFEFQRNQYEETNYGLAILTFALSGLLCYGIAGRLLWETTRARFRFLTRRTLLLQPEQFPPNQPSNPLCSGSGLPTTRPFSVRMSLDEELPLVIPVLEEPGSTESSNSSRIDPKDKEGKRGTPSG